MILYIKIYFIVCAMMATSSAWGDENGIGNAYFGDLRPDGAPRGWIYFFPEASPGLVRADESCFEIVHGGAPKGGNALRIRSEEPTRCSLQQSDLPLLPGQTLRFSVWVKGEGLIVSPTQGAWARLIFSNRRHRDWQTELDVSTVYLKSPASDFDWVLLEAVVVVPEKADRLTLDLFLWKTAGTAWFAQPSLEVAEGPVNPSGMQGDSSGLRRYASANAALASLPSDEARVVFIGDSITERWQLRQSFPGKAWHNRGIGGQMTAQMLDRFHDDVLALHPSVVVIFGGTNDIANGISAEAILSNGEQMVRLAKEADIRPVVVSLLPVSDYHAAGNPRLAATTRRPPERILEINEKLKTFCEAEDVCFVDLYTLAVDNQGQMPADWAEDGLHPNARGYASLSPPLQAAIEHELTTSSPKIP